MHLKRAFLKFYTVRGRRSKIESTVPIPLDNLFNHCPHLSDVLIYCCCCCQIIHPDLQHRSLQSFNLSSLFFCLSVSLLLLLESSCFYGNVINNFILSVFISAALVQTLLVDYCPVHTADTDKTCLVSSCPCRW